MTRVPQVGDVYDIYNGLYTVLYVTDAGVSIDNIETGEERYASIEKIKNKNIAKYMGKKAPRYKRIFGIYFIKDTTDD